MKLSNLDSLRALAALFVVAFHLNGEAPGHLHWFSAFGWMGVDLFFVISGAVIAFSAAQLSEYGGAGWRRTYAVRRFARVYPLFAVTSLAFVAVAPHFLQQDGTMIGLQIASHALMLHGMHPVTFQGLNHVTWSLATEVQFYVLVALLIRWLRTIPSLAILSTCLAISWMWNAAVSARYAQDAPFLHFLWAQLPGRLDEFGWGIVIWRFWRARAADQGPSGRPVWRTVAGLLAMIAGAALLFAWCAAISGRGGAIAAMGLTLHVALGDVGVRMMFGFSCALIVFGATLLPRWRTFFVAEQLGKVSYGIYLWHPIAIVAVGRLIVPGVEFQLLALGVALAASFASWHALEVPARRWIATRAGVISAPSNPRAAQ